MKFSITDDNFTAEELQAFNHEYRLLIRLLVHEVTVLAERRDITSLRLLQGLIVTLTQQAVEQLESADKLN